MEGITYEEARHLVREVNRVKRRARLRLLAKWIAVGFVAAVVIFSVWVKLCTDLALIESLTSVRKSNEALRQELHDATAESLAWRRKPL